MKRPFKVAIFILIVLYSSGCWDQRELNDLGIATAIGVDQSADGLILSVQVINPGQVATGGNVGISPFDSTVTTYTAEGKGFFETLRKLTKEVPRKIYLSHLRMIVFGEEFAREGLYPAIDFLVRDHEMRIDFYLVVAKDMQARDILTTYTSLEKIPANKMFNALESSAANWAATENVFLNDLVSDIMNQGKSPVLSGISVEGRNMEQRQLPINAQRMSQFNVLQYKSLGVFKEDRLIGWLTEDESKGYNFINGTVQNTIVRISDVCQKEAEHLSVEILRSESAIKASVNNGKSAIHVEVNGEANIADVECEIDLQDIEQLYSIEDEVNRVIENYMKQALQRTQTELTSDIFGFGEALKRNNLSYWETVKDNWDEEFAKLEVNMQVDIKIKGLGVLQNPFPYEKWRIEEGEE
ncbi:Ger(x)C family spore germination protein [Alkalihalobacterium alkalinitrilicum]|uniref:Ger(x)C family spore germination protein n=1 Tax=Alkalihalobacterium alkalinitrilicum TaxID=427920 RepID=UPI0009951241|nr:Ger(x)C family spore germination protein [Alkalihalobacterium alkalinitrilicum]